jgi:hypothetical protein
VGQCRRDGAGLAVAPTGLPGSFQRFAEWCEAIGCGDDANGMA